MYHRPERIQLLATVDAFTKYVWTWPTKSASTAGVIAFLEALISTFGSPRRIIADCGTAFSSIALAEYCKSKGIKLILTAVSTPRAAGQVERANATILERLIALLPAEDQWDKYLHRVTMSINNTVNEATGASPNELLFGYRPRIASVAFLENELHDDIDSEQSSGENQIRSYQEKRLNVRARAIQKMNNQQQKMIERTKDRKPPRRFKKGDLVFHTLIQRQKLHTDSKDLTG